MSELGGKPKDTIRYGKASRTARMLKTSEAMATPSEKVGSNAILEIFNCSSAAELQLGVGSVEE